MTSADHLVENGKTSADHLVVKWEGLRNLRLYVEGSDDFRRPSCGEMNHRSSSDTSETREREWPKGGTRGWDDDTSSVVEGCTEPLVDGMASQESDVIA